LRVADVVTGTAAWVLFNRRGRVVASGESPSTVEAWQAAMAYLDPLLDWGRVSKADVVEANRRPDVDAAVGEWRFECGWRVQVSEAAR
jgi:hypothetical protein